jgi:hypothetical protein
MRGGNQQGTVRAFEALWVTACTFFCSAFVIFIGLAFRFRGVEGWLGGGQLFAGAAASFLLLRSGTVHRVGVVLSGLFLYAVISAGTAMLAMSLATWNLPLWDGALLRVDRAMGYDWLTYTMWVESHPHLQLLYGISYSSILWQPAVICLALPLSNRDERLLRYLCATFATLIACTAIFAVMPVTTAWIYEHSLTTAQMDMLHLQRPDKGWVHELLEIRAGRARLVGWGIDAAIIGFPSFHCAAGVLNTWAVWKNRSLRSLFLPLNAAMIAATPLGGGHYLIDLIAGTLVAIAGIHLARGLSSALAGDFAWRLRPVPLPAGTMG